MILICGLFLRASGMHRKKTSWHGTGGRARGFDGKWCSAK